MLGYAVDGDPAVVTEWRGVAVAVTADGRTEATSAVPETAFAGHLGGCAEAGGAGHFFALGAALMRRSRRAGRRPVASPVGVALLLALGLGCAVLMVGGLALGGKPSRLGPDLAVSGAALILAAALSVWAGLSVRRRNRMSPAALRVRQQSRPADLPGNAGIRPTGLRALGTAMPPARARLRPAAWLPVLAGRAASWIAVLLTVAVLFGILFTTLDGPPARAYRHAPACAGETNLAACAGDFTAMINGVRTSGQSGNYAAVSYVTADGAINAWANFDGDGAALARAADADESQRTLLTIRVWRRSIAGADLGGTWHWAEGNPPGVAIPAVFLAVSFRLARAVSAAHQTGARACSADTGLAGRAYVQRPDVAHPDVAQPERTSRTRAPVRQLRSLAGSGGMHGSAMGRAGLWRWHRLRAGT